MNAGNSGPAYFIAIPPQVRSDTALPPYARLLYGEIAVLSSRFGVCLHSNSDFALIYGTSPRTMGRAVAALVKRGYITTEVVRNKQTHMVLGRNIRMTQAGLGGGKA